MSAYYRIIVQKNAAYMLQWTTIANFLGGIGLFLLGMRLMTDGLKVAAGGTLRELLKAATGNRLRALFFGAGITALVQSSSAVIFATIGFVNAGLLSIGPAVNLIIGANLGTTLTSWIVALVGFKLDLKLFAMPMIALGTGLWLSGAYRREALGGAIIGFGVFFLGLDVLKGAFAGLDQALDLAAFAGDGVLALLMFTGIGILLTLLMQSSSAALAITLTAAAQGIVALDAAAAIVVGANIGTTSTAVFATLSATAAARRTAAAHVIFNVIAGAVALILLPWLITLARMIADATGAADLPATQLAILHTQVNLLGVFVIWPLLPHLVTWLERRFLAAENADASLPRHLDDTVLTTPRLALDAAWQEIERMGGMAIALAQGVIRREEANAQTLAAEVATLEKLGERIIDFSARINSGGDALIDKALPDALRAAQHYRAVGESVLELAHSPRIGLSDGAMKTVVALETSMNLALTALSDLSLTQSSSVQASSPEDAVAEFDRIYGQGKADLLRRGSRGELRSPSLVRALDRLSSARRIVNQTRKATLLLLARPV